MPARFSVRFPFLRVTTLAAVLAVVGSFFAGMIAAPAGNGATVMSDFPVYAQFNPNDPLYRTGVQWGLPEIGAPQAWDVTLGSRGVVVAVVDTGVRWTLPDIEPNMWDNPDDGTHGHDYVDGDTNPTETDPSGLYHGTGVAGIIGAVTHNNHLIAGAAQVSVMAVRALGPNGQGSSFNTSQAIRFAAENGADIINLSLGTNETFGGPTDIELAINYAWRQGALIVAAAGNGGADQIGDPSLDYPARLANVVSVAAIDSSGQRASFSNYGSGLDLAAPGQEIWTLDGNDGAHPVTGTSFAAPFVTATAALLLSLDSNLTNVELWNILNSTAVQPSGSGYNTNYGWGVVNVWNAIDTLSGAFISVNAYPTSVSRSSNFQVRWSILGPPGTSVTDTHLVWGTSPGQLGNATPAQSGLTRQTYTATGLSMPSGANAMHFKVVATVNGTQYESPEKTVTVSALPDFLFVLYELLASNLLFLALFILALAAVVAFIPQRRAARARRAAYRPYTTYPPTYYVQGEMQSQPPPVPPSAPASTQLRAASPPPVEFIRPASPTTAPMQSPAPIAPAKKRCPSCGTMVNAENQFCFFCGNPFR